MTLGDAITAMYESMSIGPGGEPDWSRQNELFAPAARLVRVNDSGVFEFDLASFQADFARMVRAGELRSLWEEETSRETREFGDVAAILSEYELRDAPGGAVLGRAVKSIQLFRRGDRWWISAMIWRRLSS